MKLKGMMLIGMSLLMFVFVFAALQTWDYAVDHGLPVPWQVWALIATAVVWAIIASRLPRCWRDEANHIIDRLNEE